ncbi:drug/metabolite transporter (DMT)-like permease [Ensifer adhaerens]|uniref:Drug/metabolite transporter (DMT)-like permease n=1 Tax=Ensifer adhaerens TaxID=106592 RepID=A0ACC5SQI3_ENSAD|nr:DMT family transporter [Ensifer adhaerens]MBP1871112.1 drug/metabolite transporter (DMT)-like permease [Ensifer adhaerens]
MSGPANAKVMGPGEWAMLIALSMLWGGSFFFVGVTVKALPPFTIVALRVVLAAAALLIFLRFTGRRMPGDPRIWLAFFGMGLLNNLIPFSLIVWGQTHIASGLASILNATTPLFGVVVAHLLTDDEKLTANKLTGVLIGFLGVAVMIGPAALGGLGSNVLAQFAVLGAALSYAFAGVFARRFKRMGVAPIVTATGQVSASSLMLVPIALLVDRPWALTAPGPEVWGAIVGIALISTALAYVLFFRILETAGVTNLMLVTFLIPVSAILLGALFLGESLEPKHVFGMALIAAGLAAIDGRLWRRFRRKTPVDPDLACGENI